MPPERRRSLAGDVFLQELADKQAITEQLYRYCRSVDRIDVPLGHSVFHEDSYADYGGALYRGPGRGAIDYICEAHVKGLLHHSHQITNILIDVDGDRAGSEAYVTATLRMPGVDGKEMQLGIWARYIDQWSRRDGHWAIDRRDTVIDFDEIREVTPQNDHQRSKRDPSDPSYAVLKGQL
jgi:hypothetical protein